MATSDGLELCANDASWLRSLFIDGSWLGGGIGRPFLRLDAALMSTLSPSLASLSDSSTLIGRVESKWIGVRHAAIAVYVSVAFVLLFVFNYSSKFVNFRIREFSNFLCNSSSIYCRLICRELVYIYQPLMRFVLTWQNARDKQSRSIQFLYNTSVKNKAEVHFVSNVN